MLYKEWYMLRLCSMWLSKDKFIYHDLRNYLSYVNDSISDRHLLTKQQQLVRMADIFIARMCKRFDNRRINARFLTAGLPPPHNYKVVDTLVESRKLFDFPSHSLEYLTKRLLPEEFWNKKSAKFHGYELWDECLRGNLEAWQEMEDYNRQDVIALEALYLKIRPWIVGHPNVGNLTDKEPSKPTCPKCGSSKLIRRGTAKTQTQRYQRYRCKSCGGWSRGRFTKSSKVTRENILVN